MFLFSYTHAHTEDDDDCGTVIVHRVSIHHLFLWHMKMCRRRRLEEASLPKLCRILNNISTIYTMDSSRSILANKLMSLSSSWTFQTSHRNYRESIEIYLHMTEIPNALIKFVSCVTIWHHVVNSTICYDSILRIIEMSHNNRCSKLHTRYRMDEGYVIRYIRYIRKK